MNSFNLNEVYNFNINTIYDIKQDAEGIMWFGTNEGLVSFDGVDFVTYTKENYGIAYHNIKFDSAGGVWCSNFGGQLFYLGNGKFEMVYNASSKGDFIYDYLLQDLPEVYIIESAAGEIVSYNIKTAKEKKIYSSKNTRLLTASHSNSTVFLCVEKDQVTHTQKLKLYSGNSLINSHTPHYNYTTEQATGKINLVSAEGKTFYYDFLNGGSLIELKQNRLDTLFKFPEISNYTLNAIEYSGGYFWVLTKTGVQILQADNASNKLHSLSGISTSTVFQDAEGSFWVGTLNRGIYIIPNLNFSRFQVSGDMVAFSAQNEKGGIYMSDDRGRLFYSAPPFTDAELITSNLVEPAPLHYSPYNKRLYVGKQQSYFDGVENLYKELPDEPFAYSFKETVHLGNGYFLNTAFNQAYVISTDKTSPPPTGFLFDTLPSKTGIVRPFRSHHIAAPNNKSGVYVDYVDGLIFYGEKTTAVKHNSAELRVSKMITDPVNEDVVWAFTKAKKLHQLKAGKINQTFNLDDIFYCTAIKDSFIYAGGSKGIQRINTQTGDLAVIDETYGWTPVKITGLFIHENQLLIIGDNYLQKVPSDFTSQKPNVPPVSISGIQLNNKAICKEENLKFDYKNNNITFLFRALSAKTRGKFHFKYKLAGTGQEPVITSYLQPEASFVNLKPGNYIFEVSSCNEKGFCSEPKTVEFNIAPPFYQTWWFVAFSIFAGALLSGIIIGSIYKVKASQIRLKSDYQKLQKEIYRSKIAAIRSQMNPHFMFNALNTIQEFIITNQQDIAGEYLADFADLMRIYLHQSNEDEVSLREEEKSLKLYLRLEKLRFNDELEFKIDIENTLNKDVVKIPVMLVQPYVENSIKHGLLHKTGKKILSVTFQSADSKTVKCIIEDNGIGRDESAKINAARHSHHKSFATGANSSRIDLINQNRERKIGLEVIDLFQSGKACGTRVIITFPYVNQNH